MNKGIIIERETKRIYHHHKQEYEDWLLRHSYEGLLGGFSLEDQQLVLDEESYGTVVITDFHKDHQNED